MSDSEPRLRVRSDVRYRLFGGDAVLIRQTAAEMLVLNPIGARILEHLQAPCSAAEIAARLAEVYDAPPEEILEDTRSFLAELVERGVAERVDDGPEDL